MNTIAANANSWTARTQATPRTKLAGSAFLDGKTMPPRLLETLHSGSTYQTLLAEYGGQAKIQHIFENTQSPAEFLSVFRLIHGGNKFDLNVDDRILNAITMGKTLPSRHALAALRDSTIGKTCAADVDRLEDLTIAARLTSANAHLNLRNSTAGNTDGYDFSRFNRSVAKILREMPPRYWRAVMDQFENEAAFANNTNKPKWADEILPRQVEIEGEKKEVLSPFAIQYKEDYLRVIRHLLELEPRNVAADLKCSAQSINGFESSYSNPESSLAEAMITLYERKIDSAIAKGKDPNIRFNHLKYGELRAGYDPKIIAEYHRVRKEDAQKETNALIARTK
jgi:hypothetical protein